MPTSFDYWQNADECKKVASKCVDAMERAMLRGIAEQWVRIAEHKARREARQVSGLKPARE
jgi:hypothetical protein